MNLNCKNNNKHCFKYINQKKLSLASLNHTMNIEALVYINSEVRKQEQRSYCY